jgi:hypothetical protein
MQHVKIFEYDGNHDLFKSGSMVIYVWPIGEPISVKCKLRDAKDSGELWYCGLQLAETPAF